MRLTLSPQFHEDNDTWSIQAIASDGSRQWIYTDAPSFPDALFHATCQLQEHTLRVTMDANELLAMLTAKRT